MLEDIHRLQEEINGLQSSFADELDAVDPAEGLAMQSSLTVLAERMATINMKATGRRQLLEVMLDWGLVVSNPPCRLTLQPCCVYKIVTSSNHTLPNPFCQWHQSVHHYSSTFKISLETDRN